MGREDHPLLRWRKKHGFGGTQAARLLGISRGYLSHIENGLKEPTLRLAFNIVHKTGREVDYEDLLKNAPNGK